MSAKGQSPLKVEITEAKETLPQTSKANYTQPSIDAHPLPWSEEEDTQLDESFLSLQEGGDTATKQGGGVTETQQGGGVNETLQGDTADETQQGDRAKETQQGGGADETQQGDRANETQHGSGAKETQQGGGANETQKGGGANETQQGDAANEPQHEGGANKTQPVGTNEIQQGSGANETQQGSGANETQPVGTNETQQGSRANESQQGGGVNETQQGDRVNETQQDDRVIEAQIDISSQSQQEGVSNEVKASRTNQSQQEGVSNEVKASRTNQSQQEGMSNEVKASRTNQSQQEGVSNEVKASRTNQSQQNGLYQPVPPTGRPNRSQYNVTQTAENGTLLPHNPDDVKATHQKQPGARNFHPQPEGARQLDGLYRPVPPPGRPNQPQYKLTETPVTYPPHAPDVVNTTHQQQSEAGDFHSQSEGVRLQDGLYRPVPPPGRPNPLGGATEMPETPVAYLPHPPEELQHTGSVSTLTESNTDISPYKISNIVNTFLCSKQIRTISSLWKMEIAYLCISMLYFLTVLIITLCRLATMDDTSSLVTMEVVLLLNSLFCIYFLVCGVFFEGPYDIICLVISTCCLSSYVAVNYFFGTKGPFKQVRLIVSCALTPCVAVIGSCFIQNYREANNLVIRTVGAGTELQYSCGIMFLFFTSLKLDLQTSISLAILNLSSSNLEQKLLFPLMLVFSIGACLCGYFMVRYEKKYLVMVYVILWLIMPGCAIYMMIAYVERVSSEPDVEGATLGADVSNLKYRLCVLAWCIGSVCIVLRFFSLISSVLVYRNFGKGLKEKVFQLEEQSTVDTNRPEHDLTMETVL